MMKTTEKGLNLYATHFGGSIPRSKTRVPMRLLYVVLLVLAFGVALTILNIYELRKVQGDYHAHYLSPIEEGTVGKSVVKQPVVWVHAKRMESGYLKHVLNVFDRIGYAMGSRGAPWDVLWAHDYPFVNLSKELSQLKSHQKVNHFPGSGFITNKASLATSNIKHIPTAFKLPSQKEKFLQYAKANPDKLWVQKGNNHRGIKILKIKDLDLNKEGSFVQEYVANPYLIDGKKFDIGVYSMLASINPLRVYIVAGDTLVRFCPIDYYPFDPSVLDKYVVGDDYLPMWKVPSLETMFTDMSYSFKDTLNTYIRKDGKDPVKLWDDIHESIRSVYLNKESNLITAASRFKTTQNFFELVRFDFVFDENLNIYLMEVNMSPNLSSGHFPPNKNLYEYVVFNVLSVVGVARSVPTSFEESTDDEASMQASDRAIQVFSEHCTSKTCEDNCRTMQCKLCQRCLTVAQRETLKLAYMEHVNRGTCRRVFPKPLAQQDALDWDSQEHPDYDLLNEKNKFISYWFMAKCQHDISWCQ